MRKLKTIILCLVFFCFKQAVGQKIRIYYFIETLPDHSKRTIYAFNFVGARQDTVVDIKNIKIFLLENPSHIMIGSTIESLDNKNTKKDHREYRNKVAKLKYVEELILYGNDTDTFDIQKSHDFKFLTKSHNLKVVRLINVFQNDLFQKYIKHKYNNIVIIEGKMAGTS